MTLRPLLLVVTLLAASILAGCVDDAAPAPEEPQVADEPQTDGETGSVKGQVASASLDYLEDASVFLIQGADIRETRTDADGRFTFNAVAPGKVQVQASKIGYQNGIATVEVVAGKVHDVSLMLEVLVVKDPFIDFYEFKGYFECAFGTLIITDTCTFAWRTAYDAYKEETGSEPPFPRDPQANNKNTFHWLVASDADAIMSEMVWGSGGGTTEEMMMLLSSTPIRNDCDCSANDYIEVTGPSPLRAVVGRDLPDVYPDDLTVVQGGPLWGKVDNAENGTAEVASRGFLPFKTSLGYGHGFTLYVSAFYNSIPEPDYSGMPDQ